MQDQLDHPNVVIFPPLLMGLTLLFTIGLHWLLPLTIDFRPIALTVGVIFSVLGIASAVWGRRTMIQAGTNVNPSKATSTIVMEGPFRFTRNPLYIGITSLLIGISLMIGTWWGFVLIVPAALILHFGVVLREERYLEQKFGDSYLNYKKRVRRY